MTTGVDEAKLEQSLQDVYAPGQLRFCHDPKYPLKYSDRWMCGLGEVKVERCPALKKLCATTVAPEPASSRNSQGPTWVGGLAEVLFWVLMGALLVAIGVTLYGMRTRRRQDAAAVAERPSLSPAPVDAAEAVVAGDKDVARLLERARRAAERGEMGAAIDAAHAAAVQGLAAAGHVELDRDRTNGDYLRDLRREPPLREQFKGIVGQVEVAQFGGRVPSRNSFDRVLEDVMALLRRLAVLSLLALGGLGCSAGGAQTESDERSPHGLYALRRLLSEQGAKVHQRVEPLAKIGDDVGLIVLYATELEEPAHQRVLEWVKRGGSLVVVESHAFTQDAALEPRISRCKGKPTRGPGIELPALDLSVPGNHTFALRENQDEFLAQRVDLTCDAQPYVVTTFLGDGSITFIPDRELLWNASLSRGDNARLVAELLAAPEQTIELVGPWTGDGSQSPVQSLKAAGLSPVMLHLFALALLVAVRQGTSFGARREVTRHDRRAFSDHVRALASTYARANAEQLAGSHYGAFLIDQLRERTCPGQHPTLLQLAAAIARRVERPEGAVVQLLVEAKSAFDEAGAGDQGMNRKLISELEQLSLQAGGIS